MVLLQPRQQCVGRKSLTLHSRLVVCDCAHHCDILFGRIAQLRWPAALGPEALQAHLGLPLRRTTAPWVLHLSSSDSPSLKIFGSSQAAQLMRRWRNSFCDETTSVTLSAIKSGDLSGCF